MNKSLKNLRNNISFFNFIKYMYIYIFLKIVKIIDRKYKKDFLLESIDFIFKDRFKIKNKSIKSGVLLFISLLFIVFSINLLELSSGNKIVFKVENYLFFEDFITEYVLLFYFICNEGLLYISNNIGEPNEIQYVLLPIFMFLFVMLYIHNNIDRRLYNRIILTIIVISHIIYALLIVNSLIKNMNIAYISLLVYTMIWSVYIYFYIITDLLFEIMLLIIIFYLFLFFKNYIQMYPFLNFLNNFNNKEVIILNFLYTVFVVSLILNVFKYCLPNTWFLLPVGMMVLKVPDNDYYKLINDFFELLCIFDFIYFILFNNDYKKYINMLHNAIKNIFTIKNNRDIIILIVKSLKYLISLFSLMIIIATVYPGVNKIFLYQTNEIIKNNLIIKISEN